MNERLQVLATHNSEWSAKRDQLLENILASRETLSAEDVVNVLLDALTEIQNDERRSVCASVELDKTYRTLIGGYPHRVLAEFLTIKQELNKRYGRLRVWLATLYIGWKELTS